MVENKKKLNPKVKAPHHVKFTLEAVLSVILGKIKSLEWKDVPKEISKQGFSLFKQSWISTLILFQHQSKITSGPIILIVLIGWDIDRIYKASKLQILWLFGWNPNWNMLIWETNWRIKFKDLWVWFRICLLKETDRISFRKSFSSEFVPLNLIFCFKSSKAFLMNF